MKYKIVNNSFQDVQTGQVQKSIFYTEGNFSSDWQLKQEAAYEEYEETHEGGAYSPDVLNFMNVLKEILANSVLELLDKKEKVTIIDIGCGTSTSVPIYIPASKHINYIGLDPIPKYPERDYPFVCSRLEDLGLILGEASIDVFLFCTSLDHFESIDKIYDLIKPLASEDSVAVFVSGMHDPQFIATDHGRLYLYNLHKEKFKSGLINQIKYLNRLRIFVQLMFKRHNWLAERQSKLDRRIPLDAYHFYYFQYKDYHDFMQKKMGTPVLERILEGGIVINVNKI